jgi:hypothetical protein
MVVDMVAVEDGTAVDPIVAVADELLSQTMSQVDVVDRTARRAQRVVMHTAPSSQIS